MKQKTPVKVFFAYGSLLSKPLSFSPFAKERGETLRSTFNLFYKIFFVNFFLWITFIFANKNGGEG